MKSGDCTAKRRKLANRPDRKPSVSPLTHQLPRAGGGKRKVVTGAVLGIRKTDRSLLFCVLNLVLRDHARELGFLRTY